MPVFLRRLLFVALLIGLVGTLAELLLLEHFEGTIQLVPLILIGAGLLVLVAHAIHPGEGSVRGMRLLMFAFVAAGLAGTWFHYRGNADFELEITPDMPAWPLLKAALTGATPVLAPGSMIQLGLIGIAWCFRHPALNAGGHFTDTNDS